MVLEEGLAVMTDRQPQEIAIRRRNSASLFQEGGQLGSFTLGLCEDEPFGAELEPTPL